jgi:nitrous oxidase accessory protein
VGTTALRKLIFIVLLAATFPSECSILRVGNGCGYRSIRAALSRSRNGDTLIINPGVYREGNLVVDKHLTVIGRNFPEIDGEGKFEVLSIKASRVHIEGLKICRSSSGSLEDPCGIKVYNARQVYLTGNRLADNFFGIYLQYCSNCSVSGNTISGSHSGEQNSGNGIHCWKSDSLRISSNSISGHRDGIYFEFVTNSTINGNDSHNNIRYGLHFMFSHKDAYLENRFSGNGAGVAVMFTRSVTMTGNTFSNNWGDASYGLLLKEISDSRITANHFVKNTVGILMEGTSRIQVQGNHFDSNGWGMKIQASCMDNRIVSNNFSGNTFDVSTNGSLVLNTFEENYWDKYEGYDLNRDGWGDVPYRPLSLFSIIAETTPSAMLLFRSFMVSLLDRTERIIPSLTPENFIDRRPKMIAVSLFNGTSER